MRKQWHDNPRWPMILDGLTRMATEAILAVALTVAGAANGQVWRYNLKWRVAERNFVDTIPIFFEDNQVYVEVEALGQIYRMNIDTGSSQGIAYEGGAWPTGGVLGRVESRDANLHIDTIPVVGFPPFRMGNLHIVGYAGTLLRRNVETPAYDAIIGFDLFNKGLSAKIDTRAGYMVMTDRRHFFDNEAGCELRYRLERFVPHVRVSPFAGSLDDALFDTGSRTLYVMGNGAWRVLQGEVADIERQAEGRTWGRRTIGGHGTARADELVFLRLDRLAWGGFEFLDLRTMTTTGSSRIGAELLNYGSLIVDPRRKSLKFQPYDGVMACSPASHVADIAFVPHEGETLVGMVREGSSYWQAGFRQGDVVVALNGQPLRGFDEFSRYPFVSGRVYTFGLRTDSGLEKNVRSTR